MSPIDLKTVLPSTPTNAVSSGTTNALLHLIKTGQAVNLQVLKVLSAQSVSFQGTQGPITLNFSDTSQFTPGSRWALVTTPDSHELVLKPLAPGQEGQSARPLLNTGQTTQSRPAIVSGQLAGGNTSGSFSFAEQSSINRAGLATSLNIETVLSATRHEAATRQNSLSGIFATLSSVASGNIPSVNQLPEGASIQKLAQQILGFRLTPDVTAGSVRQAVHASGIFHEAQIVASGKNSGFMDILRDLTGGRISFSQLAEDSGVVDLKQLIRSLQNMLVRAGARLQSSTHTIPSNVPALPERDGPVEGQRPSQFPLSDRSDGTFLSRFLDQTVESLARIKLLQLASLPQGETEHLNTGDKAKLQYNMEIPLSLMPGQTSILGLRVTRDGSQSENGQKGHGRGWSIDMAMDTEETGPIDAHIHLTPGGLNVTIWAGKPEFAEMMQETAESLRAGLSEEGLDVDSIEVLKGRRIDLRRYLHHGAGYFLDNTL